MRGPKFLQQFACTADRCIDTCCQSWRIAVDEPHYRRLEQLLPAERLSAVRPTGGTPFAVIQLDEHGFCPFLEDKLCSLHRDHGDAVLGNACASYPRSTSELHGEREATAELSCPEVARLCLLSPDAMELVPLSDGAGGRGTLRQRLAGEHPWLRHFSDIRQLALALLGEREYPLASRLFFVAYLAHRLGAWYHRDCADFDPARIDAERAVMERPDTLAQLHSSLQAAPAKDPLAATILTVILSARLRSPAPRAFVRVMQETLRAELGEEASGDPSQDLTKLGAQRLDALHRARTTPARVDDLLEAYCKHHLYTEWYLKAPSLLIHLMGLFIRVAALRWLLLARPDGDPVEIVYSFSRTIEHNQALADEIARAVERTGMTTLAHAVSLLKF